MSRNDCMDMGNFLGGQNCSPTKASSVKMFLSEGFSFLCTYVNWISRLESNYMEPEKKVKNK